MIERKSIQTLVYEELKRNIMSMKLEPGQTMSTQEIATKLNVSRTPVREAFRKLAKDDPAKRNNGFKNFSQKGRAGEIYP